MKKRRQLLLVSLAALAIIFAGCKSAEVDDGSSSASSSLVDSSTASGSSSSSSSSGTSSGSSGSSSSSSSSGSSSTSGSGSSSGSSSSKDYAADNEALWAAIQAARQAAIDAGAPDANPAAFAAAEAEYEAQKKIMDAGGSSKDMSEALRDLSYRYQGLTALANAQKKKAFVDENDWSSYNKSAYDSGSKKISDLTNPLSTITTGKAFFDTASSAEKDFDSVITNAYRSIAKEERQKAYDAKKNADSVKAAVSRKADYDKAVNTFKNGDTHFVTGNPQGAIEDYVAAGEAFTTLYDEISEARAQALAAIEEAKKRVSESEDVAVEADKTAPLGNSPVEGIESEDAKLLDDDDFSEAEGAQAAAEDAIGEDVE